MGRGLLLWLLGIPLPIGDIRRDPARLIGRE
jgi:hypothetical protein